MWFTNPPYTSSSQRIGKFGERIARRHLERAGYRLIKSNWRCHFGELDAIYQSSKTLVFVEVKTRHERASDCFPPGESIDELKQKRLYRLGEEFYRCHHRTLPRHPKFRFDLVLITTSGSFFLRTESIQHHQDALQNDFYTNLR